MLIIAPPKSRQNQFGRWKGAMRIWKVTLAALCTVSTLSCSQTVVAPDKRNLENEAEKFNKSALVQVRPRADRAAGIVQLTGKDLVLGQKEFPKRTPADPMPFIDPATGEAYIYGTQVDGTGFSYLKYASKEDLLRGAAGELIGSVVFLPNGKLMHGAEAIWDTYRLPYAILRQAFSKDVLDKSYAAQGIPPGSDLYYGGIALQEDGSLGRWTTDNWRRRVHVIAPVKGRLQILPAPVFNPIRKGASELDYKGFGQLPFLPGNYIGHAYGPNFKLVRTAKGLELWIISEEVTRRVNEKVPAEVTEIVARKMLTPFQATSKRILLVSVNDKNNRPHPDSDRGEKMAHTKLIEGFRPTSVTPEGVRVNLKAERDGSELKYSPIPPAEQKEYYFMTGSQGNFAGDDYDAIVAVRPGTAIGRYEILTNSDGYSWKKFLTEIKKTYHLSWAGRGAFLQDDGKEWWMLFHAVDKELKPDGSYSGVIPSNTPEYHRNLYAVPVQFFINENGRPDMMVR